MPENHALHLPEFLLQWCVGRVGFEQDVAALFFCTQKFRRAFLKSGGDQPVRHQRLDEPRNRQIHGAAERDEIPEGGKRIGPTRPDISGGEISEFGFAHFVSCP